MKKKGLFGVIGIILFLLAVFIILGLSLFGQLSLSFVGDTPKMHINARVVSSNYSNDCDIFLMNILRFKDISTGLTYGQLMSLAKQRKEGDLIGARIKRVIEKNITLSELECFKIRAQVQDAKEPFLDYPPGVDCEREMGARSCEAYVPDIDPDNGWIRVEMSILETSKGCIPSGGPCSVHSDCCDGYLCSSGGTCVSCQTGGCACNAACVGIYYHIDNCETPCVIPGIDEWCCPNPIP